VKEGSDYRSFRLIYGKTIVYQFSYFPVRYEIWHENLKKIL